MRIVFFGTPDFALPVLDELAVSRNTTLAVVTQPDRPRGRGRTLQPTPVKARARELGLPVLDPEKINRRAFIDEVLALKPDALVVAAYGLKVPTRLLETPPFGSINIHPSLLPKYRGAAPVEWAVINGDAETGVTIMKQSAGWDEGDLFLNETVAIGPEETAGELAHRLARIGARLLIEVLDRLEAGSIEARPQDHALATFAPKITPELERMNWNQDARSAACLIRGLAPTPGAHAPFRGKSVKLLRAREINAPAGEPGTVVEVRKREGPVVATRNGAVLLTELQPEGKRPMTGKDFCNGMRVTEGETFKTD